MAKLNNDMPTIPEPSASDDRAASLKDLQDDITRQQWIGRGSRMRIAGGGNTPDEHSKENNG